MPPNQGNLITEKNLIREGMEIKEDDELLEICASRNSADWTEAACDVALEILRERGVDVDAALAAFVQQMEEQNDGDSDGDFLDLSHVDWQNDSAEVIFYELCRRNLVLDEMNEIFENAFLEDDDSPEPPSELAEELTTLTDEELMEAWIASDPLEWDHEEISDLRREFAKRGVIPMYMLDAPTLLISKVPYLTEESLTLPGWPGYRFRPGRCGLDPLDRNCEGAHLEGLFIRYLFTLKLRTGNPVYIRLMTFLALFCLLPLLLFATNESSVGIVFLPCIIIGLFLTLNVALSYHDLYTVTEPEDQEPPFWPPE